MQHEGDDDENNAPATHSALHAARETERRGSAAADKKKRFVLMSPEISFSLFH